MKYRSLTAIAILLLQTEVYCHVIEPKCSKFDYEEKLLEKMVRLEHSTNNMMEEFKDISLQVKDALTTTRAELTETKQHLERDTNNSSQTLSEQFEDLSGHMRTEFETLKLELAEAKRQIEEERQTVAGNIGRSTYAFNAQWVRDESPSRGDTLIFTRVPLNQNSVYSSNTGEYIVPVDGTYMFSTTLCSYSNKSWLKIKILADTTVMHLFLSGHTSSTTCTSTSTVGQLQKGMKVKIVVNDTSGSRIFYQGNNDRMCTFSGFLIN